LYFNYIEDKYLFCKNNKKSTIFAFFKSLNLVLKMRTFNHIGIITSEQKVGASYMEGLKVWLTDYSKSPNKIEFLRFEDGSCMHELIQKQAHIAYTVPSLEEALKDAKIIFGPADVNENLSIAFIEEEGIPVELMEIK
jgi:hypothetical protein